MKTVLFFDRCDLTRLYILLTKELQGKVNIIHVSFSDVESKMLLDAGIKDYIDYQKELSILVDTLKPSVALLEEIDNLIISQSKGLMSLNGSIQSDRGYSVLSYKESLLLACCHYSAWKAIFEKYHVDVMYHEPASQFMTHIAALLCKRQGGMFIYPTQLQSDKEGYFFKNIDGEDFTCKELEDNYQYYKLHPAEIDKARCNKYIEQFKKSYTVAFSNIVSSTAPKWRLWLSSLKNRIILCQQKNKFDILKNNIDYWILRNNREKEKLYNLKQYKKRKIRFSQSVEGEKYYYYSVHLEPEATVLYLSGGHYTNQIKLIENIAASLPPNYYLYVKDHPHEYAYRKADDYERLMKVPNIRLIDQRIPGKRLVKDAVGVFSINGTVGFEGIMLRKSVFCFGKSYYTPYTRVNYIENIKDARKIIYDSLKDDNRQDDDFYAFIYAYLTSMHEGFVTYFGDRSEKAGIDPIANAKLVAKDIMRLVAE